MHIINNFLDEQANKVLFEIINSNQFIWYKGEVINPNISTVDRSYYQLSHTAFVDNKIQSNHFSMLDTFFFNKLNIKALIRVKINCTWKTDKIIEHGWHIDYNYGKTAVYYVNTTNGYTAFKEGKNVDGIGNRMVVFDSERQHSGTSCTDKEFRYVINFNFYD